MAYCDQCGAYIPDGRSQCLACGYDAQAAERAEAQAAQAREYKEPGRVNTDFLKEQLEKQRKRQQENSRKWAEAEKAQREKARRSHEAHYSATRSTDTKKYSAPNALSGSKLFSLLSYFGFLCLLPYLFCKNDDFALFHAKQGLILFVVGIAAKVAASILGLGWLVTIGKLYFIYKGVTSVLDGRKDKLPYIGSLF